MVKLESVSVGIDIDGVFANFGRKFSEIANNLFGDRCPIITENNILAWSWTEWYPITKEELPQLWTVVENTPDFWETLDMLDPAGIQYVIDNLIKHPRINTYFITARHPSIGKTIAKQSASWLSSVGVPNPQVLELYEKGPAIKVLNIRHFIDDRAENVISSLEYSDAMSYVIDVPHNRHLETMPKAFGNPRYKRVNNLKEFTDLVINSL